MKNHVNKFIEHLEKFRGKLKEKKLDPFDFINYTFDVKLMEKNKIKYDNYTLFKGFDFLIGYARNLDEKRVSLENKNIKNRNTLIATFVLDLACFHYSLLNFVKCCMKQDENLDPVVEIDQMKLHEILVEKTSFYSSLPMIENEKFPNSTEFRKSMILRLETKDDSTEALAKNLKIVNLFKELIQFINEMEIPEPGESKIIPNADSLFKYRILVEMMIEKPYFKIDLVNYAIHRFI